jgi:hypothetical protein
MAARPMRAAKIQAVIIDVFRAIIKDILIRLISKRVAPLDIKNIT